MKSFIGDRKTGAIREAEDKDKALSFIEEYKRSIEEAKMNFKMAMEQKAIQDAVTGQQKPGASSSTERRPRSVFTLERM